MSSDGEAAWSPEFVDALRSLACKQRRSPPYYEADGAWALILALRSLEARGDRRGPRIAIIKSSVARNQAGCTGQTRGIGARKWDCATVFSRDGQHDRPERAQC